MKIYLATFTRALRMLKGSRVAAFTLAARPVTRLMCVTLLIGSAVHVHAKAPNGSLDGKLDCDEYMERRGTAKASSVPISLKLFDGKLYLTNGDRTDILVGSVTSAGDATIEIKFAQSGGLHPRPVGRFVGALIGVELKAEGGMFDDAFQFRDCRLALQLSPSAAPPSGLKPVSYPCVSKVCLSDAIFDHIADTPWRKVVPRDNSKEPLIIRAAHEWLAKNTRGLTPAQREQLIPYFLEDSFDANALRVLKDSKAVFCRQRGLTGDFASESGYRTEVYVSYLAGVGLRVTRLQRWFPTDDGIVQRQIAEQVREQYPYLFDQMGRSIRTTKVPWSFGAAEFASSKLVFILEDTDFDNDALARQPECAVARPSLN